MIRWGKVIILLEYLPSIERSLCSQVFLSTGKVGYLLSKATMIPNSNMCMSSFVKQLRLWIRLKLLSRRIYEPMGTQTLHLQAAPPSCPITSATYRHVKRRGRDEHNSGSDVPWHVMIKGHNGSLRIRTSRDTWRIWLVWNGAATRICSQSAAISHSIRCNWDIWHWWIRFSDDHGFRQAQALRRTPDRELSSYSEVTYLSVSLMWILDLMGLRARFSNLHHTPYKPYIRHLPINDKSQQYDTVVKCKFGFRGANHCFCWLWYCNFFNL